MCGANCLSVKVRDDAARPSRLFAYAQLVVRSHHHRVAPRHVAVDAGPQTELSHLSTLHMPNCRRITEHSLHTQFPIGPFPRRQHFPHGTTSMVVFYEHRAPRKPVSPCARRCNLRCTQVGNVVALPVAPRRRVCYPLKTLGSRHAAHRRVLSFSTPSQSLLFTLWLASLLASLQSGVVRFDLRDHPLERPLCLRHLSRRCRGQTATHATRRGGR